MNAASNSEWLQLVIELAASADLPAQLEQWESALEDVGALSLTYHDAEDNPVFEPKPGEIALWDSLKLTALLPRAARAH